MVRSIMLVVQLLVVLVVQLLVVLVLLLVVLVLVVLVVQPTQEKAQSTLLVRERPQPPQPRSG